MAKIAMSKVTHPVPDHGVDQLGWKPAGQSAVRRVRSGRVTPQALSLTRQRWLERYQGKIFAGLRLVGHDDPVAVFVNHRALIGVAAYDRNDPRCFYPVEVREHDYHVKLKILRAFAHIKQDWEILSEPSLQDIFPWRESAVAQLKAAATAFDDFYRSSEYRVRYRTLPPEAIAEQIRRGEDITPDEERLPLAFIISELRKDPTTQDLAEVYEGSTAEPWWDKLDAILHSNLFNRVLWESLLTRQQPRGKLIGNFWQWIDKTKEKSEQARLLQHANIHWFVSSSEFIASLWANGVSKWYWGREQMSLPVADCLLVKAPPTVQVGLLRALPQLWQQLGISDLESVLRPDGELRHSLYRRIFLERPLLLRDHPPTKEVGSEAQTTCERIHANILDQLQKKQADQEKNISDAEERIQKLQQEISRLQGSIGKAGEKITRIGEDRKALAQIFESKRPKPVAKPTPVAASDRR